MFRIIVQQTKNYVRQQNRQYARSHRYRPNAGVRRQIRAGTNEVETYESESSEWNDIDDQSKYEGDLTNTSNTYDEYRQESIAEKEKLKRFIVYNKYFKEKKLSFLTWAEMEQIRLLNSTDAEEWNEQRLAESFPADLSTIKKVLKANWQPRDAKRVAKHDEKVRSNWKCFVNGEINELDPQFSEHLHKFSARNLNQKLDYDGVLKKEMPKPKGTEFLGIITSCEKYKEMPKKIASKSPKLKIELPAQSTKETVLLGSIGSHKLFTFKPNNLDGDESENESVRDERDIIFDNSTGIDTKNTETDLSKQNSTANPFSITKYEKNEVQLDGNELKQLSVPSIRYHIEIPSKLFKEGATYRLGDCYYDDDGEFLYRVPGMNGGRT